MRQTLSLRMGQQLTMTPALQQAIRLVGLSTLELHAEIRAAIEANPMLEYDEEAYDDEAAAPDDRAAADEDWDDTDYEDSSFDDRALDGADFDEVATADGVSAAEAPADGTPAGEGSDGEDGAQTVEGDPGDPAADEAAMQEANGDADDSAPQPGDVTEDWDGYRSPSDLSAAPGQSPGETPLEERSAAAQTLQDHLAWQLNLARLSERDRLIGLGIIDAVDADGRLTEPIDEIAAAVASDVEEAEVEAVLRLVQQFDPAGIAARDLAECLSLQLRQLPADTPWRDQAIVLVEEHFDALAAQDARRITRRMRLGQDEFDAVLALVRSLDPRPGSSVGETEVDYVEPDVVVRRSREGWLVELNDRAAPRVRLNGQYAALVKRADTSRDNLFLKNNLQEARFFLKSIDNRNDTLLKVAASIVERQSEFLERGEEAMQPLVLADIADAVGMHESTVSRATTRKYMLTPRGVFELKYFFSSHVGTVGGGEISSTAIRALIRKLTASENPCKPLSDSAIATLLGERDIKVARRTVAKYRESLAIPSSNERRRLAWNKP